MEAQAKAILTLLISEINTSSFDEGFIVQDGDKGYYFSNDVAGIKSLADLQVGDRIEVFALSEFEMEIDGLTVKAVPDFHIVRVLEFSGPVEIVLEGNIELLAVVFNYAGEDHRTLIPFSYLSEEVLYQLDQSDMQVRLEAEYTFNFGGGVVRKVTSAVLIYA